MPGRYSIQNTAKEIAKTPTQREYDALGVDKTYQSVLDVVRAKCNKPNSVPNFPTYTFKDWRDD